MLEIYAPLLQHLLLMPTTNCVTKIVGQCLTSPACCMSEQLQFFVSLQGVDELEMEEEPEPAPYAKTLTLDRPW